MTDSDKAFYDAWTKILDWMREYAASHEGVEFVKQGDFPDYIYRMERPYDLPTTVMSASLSDLEGNPVLLLYASPRTVIFKEIVVHPFATHVYRKLKLGPDGASMVEGKRVFDRDRLLALADDLFGFAIVA